MSTIDNAELAKRLEELEERVLQYKTMQLPGQPMSTHMGTSYLIDDLLTALKELSALRAQEGMEAEARFLLDRLDELDLTEMSGPLYRDFAGHVAPSIARLRAMIAAAPQEAGR